MSSVRPFDAQERHLTEVGQHQVRFAAGLLRRLRRRGRRRRLGTERRHRGHQQQRDEQQRRTALHERNIAACVSSKRFRE